MSAVLLGALLAVAAAPPQPGEWRLESQTTKVRVLSWGLFCGKEPKNGRGIPGAVYSLATSRGDFLLKGAGRLLQTDGCSLDPPAYKVRQRDQSGGAWRVECEAPAIAGQPQVTEHRFELTSPTELRYVTRGERRKNKAMDSCRFAYETEMRFVLATEAGPCAQPGPPQKLVLDPATRDVQPGTRVCFKAHAMDAQGCAVDVKAPSYSVEPSGDVDGEGCLWAPRKVDATVVLAVSATSGAAKGGAIIRVLAPGHAPRESIRETVAKSRSAVVKQLGSEVLAGDFVIKTPAEEVEEEPVAAPPPPPPEEPSFAWWWALLALIPVGAAAALLIRRRAQPVPPPPASPQKPENSWRCPRCNFQYAEPGRCAHDGTVLVGNDTRTRTTMFIPQFGGMKCPTCGQKYPSRARFCGNDRTPLIPDLPDDTARPQ